MVLLGALGFAVEAARAQTASETTLTVLGRGVVRLPPDQATVLIDVRSRGRSRVSARSRANARTRRVIRALLAVGVERSEIQTSGIRLSRRGVRRRGGGRGVSFVASSELTVRTGKVDRVSAIVDAATRAGADDIDGPNFSFADPSTGRVAAEGAAIDDARRRADAAAARLGLRVTGVRSVNLDPFESGDPATALPQRGEARGEVSPPTPVERGTEEVVALVSVVFVLGP